MLSKKANAYDIDKVYNTYIDIVKTIDKEKLSARDIHLLFLVIGMHYKNSILKGIKEIEKENKKNDKRKKETLTKKKKN